MSLKQKTISNVKWSFVESMSLKAISFVLGIILARLLTPADFGLLAIVNVFYLLVTLFIDGGLKEALIQKKDATDVHYSTVFWLNLFMGLFLYTLLFIAAPFIEDFYGYQNLSFYIRIQSLTLIIESFGIVQIVKATKELNLKKITKARIPASLISFGVGIFLAFHGYGILSLISQQLVNVSLYVVFLMVSIRYKPRFICDLNEVKELYVFGSKVLGVVLISRFYAQSLNLIYAKFYSPNLLGLNNKSSSLQNVPIEIINTTFMKGVYPTMVVLKDDKIRLRELFITNISLLTILMIYINGIFFYNATEIIYLLLGEKWIGSVIYLKIISAGSLFIPISIQAQNIFKTRNTLSLFLKLEIFNKIVTLIFIACTVSYLTFPRLLLSTVIFNSLFSFLYLYIASKELEFSFPKEFFKIILSVILFALLGGFLQKIIGSFSLNHFWKIVIFIIIYSLCSFIITYFLNRRLLLSIKHFIK